MKKRIYIVDDEPKIGDLFATVLNRDGFDARAFISPSSMLDVVSGGEKPDLVLTDLLMPGMNGIELLEELNRRKLHVPIVIMTAHSSVATAVDAMRLGAFHYLQKPINLEEMRSMIKQAFDVYDQPAETQTKGKSKDKGTGKSNSSTDAILGSSLQIQTVRSTIKRLHNVPKTTVLIRGETGTGKNLIAATLHHNSPGHKNRFMEINCAALPDNLLEAELFGYEKGAFTDARNAKPGLLEVADGGTVFLDEIDSMSTALQAKLLSFLESRMFRRLGGVEDLKVSTRILCASNADLEKNVADKKFRKDLFYRINVVNIFLPSLRQMGEDMLLIGDKILASLNKEIGTNITGFSRESIIRLRQHNWPGNVRELRNVIERAIIFTTGSIIEVEQITFSDARIDKNAGADGDFRFQSGGSLELLEQKYIKYILQTRKANYSEVARILGISKKTLWEKRKKYDLDEATEAATVVIAEAA